MDNKNAKTLKYIDNAIFVFVFIYLGSLTNSIFVNQIGYYFTLILLLVRMSITKENVFGKTGLELPLIIMIGAEILATVFAVNKGQSIHNFLKFILLIPTLYLFSASAFDYKKLKTFFKIYMGFALAGCLLYLALSYEYVIYNQFQIQQSGPSPFKYPITASELISFTVIFFFAFLVNEKTTRRNKILLFAGFVISSLALLAIYKRTGWFGTAAGILFILVYSRKWKIVIPFMIVAAALMVNERSVSEIYVYKESGNELVKLTSAKTAGRAYDILTDSGKVYLSDYDNGLEALSKEGIGEKYFTAPSALASFSKWQGNYYIGYLNDTRFVLYEKSGTGFKESGHFISPGFTTCYKSSNGYLYVCDSDSGMTVFKNPGKFSDTVRFSAIKGVSKIFADSSAIITYSSVKNELNAYSLNNRLPGKVTFTYAPKASFDVVYYNNGDLLLSEKEGLTHYKLNSSGFEKTETIGEIKNTYMSSAAGDTLMLVSFDKKIFKTVLSGNGLKILSRYKTDFVPGKIAYNNGITYLTKLRESRFAATFDKYNLSNLTRVALWTAGIKIFKDHPITGVGNIDLAQLYISYKNDYDKEIQGHMHNNFVHILVTLGIIGFAAFLFLLYRIFSSLNKLYKDSKGEPELNSFILAALGGFVAFVVAGLTEWNFGDHEIITMVWFTIGMSIGLFRSYKRSREGN